MHSLDFSTLIFLLLCGHAICDFALQTEWIATNKNRHVRKGLSPEMREKTQVIWPYLMSAHSLHHALAVYLVTQSLVLGWAEFLAHWLTDFGKCEKWFGFHADQMIHIACKFLWVFLLVNHWV